MAISACSFRSSASSSSSSAVGVFFAVGTVSIAFFLLSFFTPDKLTRRIRHPLYLIVHRHAPRLQHPLVQRLLLQLRQLLVQFILVHSACLRALSESLRNLLADRVLLAQILHRLVDLVDREAAVDVLDGFAGVLHGVQGLLVDVGGFDAADLALDGHHLRRGLLELVLEGLFAAEGGFGDCVVVLLVVYSFCVCDLALSLLTRLQHDYPTSTSNRARLLTAFIRAHMLPRNRILLVHLVLQVLLPLRQHLQRAAQAQDGVLRAVLFLRCITAPKATEAPARHLEV
jgi:hypothetical protein